MPSKSVMVMVPGSSTIVSGVPKAVPVKIDVVILVVGFTTDEDALNGISNICSPVARKLSPSEVVSLMSSLTDMSLSGLSSSSTTISIESPSSIERLSGGVSVTLRLVPSVASLSFTFTEMLGAGDGGLKL